MMKTQTKETQEKMTPKKALEILKEGNDRFANNLKVQRDLSLQVKETEGGQWPFAIILSCIDSRTSSELIFDQGIGDVFSARIAGNVVNTDILGSMEFACKLAGSKLIVVLGHSSCGAVKGACDHAELGNLTHLLSKITPAVDLETETKTDRTSANKKFVGNVAKLNVIRNVNEILEQSPILKEMQEKGEIGIVGGMHHLESGKVELYDEATYI